MPLIYLCLAWLAGTVVGILISLPAWTLALSLPFFAAAVLLRRQRRGLILAGLCLLALAGGALRYRAAIPAVDDSSLQYYNHRGVAVIEGMVADPPDVHGQSLSFRFSATQITREGQTFYVKGDALVRLPFYRELHYGDVLRLTGRPETPERYDDFDYRGYLANQRIHSVINYPGVQALMTGAGFPPLAWTYAARESAAEALTSCLPGPQGPLAQAILLGLRGGLPDSLLQSFYTTGTTHLIAISGLNLTIVLGMVLAFTIWLLGRRDRLYIWISLAFIWLYTLLTGLPATMVRAALMGSVFLLAELLGRQRTGITALSLAAALMLAADPLVLHDISFQLSFLSMLGLVLISPWLIRYASPSGEAGNRYLQWARQAVVISFGTTLAAIIATWPVTAATFHSFSLVSLPATFFAMPAFPAIMVTSLLTAAAGLAWHPLGVAFGWLAWLFLSYFLLVVDIFSSIPAATITGLSLQPWHVIAYYFVLCTAICAFFRRDLAARAWAALKNTAVQAAAAVRNIQFQQITLPAIMALLMANILVGTALAVLPDGKLHVSILDVGQGETILIRTPQGRNILVDAGPDPLAACTQLGRRLPFWDRSIDLLVLTQLQSDHTAGALEVMRKYDVRCLALPPCPSSNALSREVLAAAAKYGVKQASLATGRQVTLGNGLGLAVLNPPDPPFTGTADDANNNSLVLRLSYKNVAFLLTADIEGEAERYLLMNRADLPSTILKVAHHGSRGSTSKEFLARVAPRAAIISCGAENRFGHPSGETLQRLTAQPGTKVFTTPANGTVEFNSDGERLWYSVEKAAQQ